MDAFFSQRCVTSDAAPTDASAFLSWGRSELALVQEQRGAFGVSRAVLASVVSMVAKCKKTAKVLLFTMDAPCVAPSPADDKVTTRDYSADTSLFHSLLGESAAPSLIEKLQHDVDAFTASYAASPSSSAKASALSSRPLVVAIDSLNVLLQSCSLVQVLLFIKKLRETPRIGAVVTRIDASAESQTAALALAAAATALVSVETRSSLSAYSVLAKDRQREVPKSMDGLVQLVRLKKVSESIEFFRVSNGTLTYFTQPPTVAEASDKSARPAVHTQPSPSTAVPATLAPSAIPLPVAQGEVSFSLSMSAQEKAAKSKVQLPYVHQGQAIASETSSSSGIAAVGAGSLFFIDEDDPDWDDDDLDDDLDI